jgi:hypothetical protein
MIYQVTIPCGEPDCQKTADPFCEILSGETAQQFRQRNPLFEDVLCSAKHSGNYLVSSAVAITAVPDPSA